MKNKLLAIIRLLSSTVIIFTILYLIIGEINLPDESQNNYNQIAIFDAKWTQLLPDGSRKEVTIPGTVDVFDGEAVVETTLPSNIHKNDIIVFRSSKQEYEVLVDGETRISYNTNSSRIWGNTSPTKYLYLELTPSDEGKTLTVHTRSEGNYAGIFHDMYYSDYTGFWVYQLKTQGFSFVVGLFMLIAGILALVIAGGVTLIYKRAIKLLHISVGVIIIAVWILANSSFRQVIFPNISIISDIAFIMVSLMPAPFALYMDSVQSGKYHEIYIVEALLSNLNALILLILQAFNIVDYADSFLVSAFFLMVFIITMFVTLIIDCVTKRIKKYLITAISIAIASGIAIALVVDYLINDSTMDVSPACLGLLLMLSISIFDTFVEFANLEKERNHAVSANDLKSQFLANMSHEIRTPINAIIGMNEMILRESNDDTIKGYANDVENSSKALLATVNDVLDFSKIESGKMDIINNEYNLRNLIDRVVSIIGPRFDIKGLTFKINVENSIPNKLIGDELRIQQIMMNLLTNAVKYTDKGSVVLNIRHNKLSDETINLSFVVRDTGKGIKSEDLEVLFDSFKRLDLKENNSIEGTGLGLSITKRLTELMEGSITVESEYRAGSTFTIVLPQKVSDPAPIGSYDRTQKASVDNNSDSKKRELHTKKPANEIRILVADDVPMNLKVFTGLLKGTGVTIDAVNSGIKALENWNTTTYDIVFLDHMMPQMDGIECGHKMRESLDKNPNTPLIMLTANAISGMREMYLSEGFDDYLSKPFKSKDLINMIDKYC